MTEEKEHEVCFLIGAAESLLWADLAGQSHALPDSRRRWLAIWEHRQELVEIAHTHPNDLAAFSNEDETTMGALGSALGRALRFSVVTRRRVLLREDGEDRFLDDEPWWVELIRVASGMKKGT